VGKGLKFPVSKLVELEFEITPLPFGTWHIRITESNRPWITPRDYLLNRSESISLSLPSLGGRPEQVDHGPTEAVILRRVPKVELFRVRVDGSLSVLSS